MSRKSTFQNASTPNLLTLENPEPTLTDIYLRAQPNTVIVVQQRMNLSSLASLGQANVLISTGVAAAGLAWAANRVLHRPQQGRRDRWQEGTGKSTYISEHYPILST